MKKGYRQALLAGAVTTLFSVQGWAADAQQLTSPDTTENTQTQIEPTQKMAPAAASETQPQQGSPDTGLSMGGAQELYNRSPDELTGLDVIGREGRMLGRVSEIVSDRTSGRFYAVISRGGILGIGDSKYAVELDKLNQHEDKLHMPVSAPELEMSPEYTEERYVAVTPEDHPISEFSAFEAAPESNTGSSGQ